MNECLKPFRLINIRELKELEQSFAKKIQLWNEQYALFALAGSLSACPTSNEWGMGYVFVTKEEQPIALLVQQDLAVLKQSLFGDTSDCFNSIAEMQLGLVLQQVIGIESLQKKPLNGANNWVREEWFYTGSPTLALSLKVKEQALTVYLHPKWVLQALPRSAGIKPSKIDLEEALSPQLLEWQVELTPMRLQVKNMLSLRVGDVIKTDHLLSTPLLLKHQQQTVCHGEIGKTNHYKSIKITSSL